MIDPLLKAFQDFLSEEEKSPRTIAAYRRDVQDFLTSLPAHESLEALTRQQMIRYKQSLAQTYAVSSRNRKLAAISAFLTFMRDEQGIPVPPVRIKFFKEHRRRLHWFLSEQEVLRLIAAAEQKEDWRAAALFAGLFYSGARISELLQIQARDLGQQTILIEGKGAIERDLYLSHPTLRATWERYAAAKKVNGVSCPYLFSGIRGKMSRQGANLIIQHYAGQVRPRLNRHKAHAHAFRHGCAMWLKAQGYAIDQVAAILGHSSLDTTRIYFSDTKTDLLKIMAGGGR